MRECFKKLPLINLLDYFQRTNLNDRRSGASLSNCKPQSRSIRVPSLLQLLNKREPRLPPLAYGCHSAWNVAGAVNLGNNLELFEFLNYRTLRGGENGFRWAESHFVRCSRFSAASERVKPYLDQTSPLHACDYAALISPTRAQQHRELRLLLHDLAILQIADHSYAQPLLTYTQNPKPSVGPRVGVNGGGARSG